MLLARFDDGSRVALPALYTTDAGTGEPPLVGVRVKVDVLTVAALMASLNVTTTFDAIATLVALFSGETFVTVGEVRSGGAAVENVDEKAVRPLFARSFAPPVTLTVYPVLYARADDGVSVAVPAPAL